jgi:hypothetical protein
VAKETFKKNTQDLYTLAGTETDSKPAIPLPYTPVRTKDNKHRAVTNESGRYQLKLPSGLNQLVVSPMGHVQVERKIMIYSDGSLDFTAPESINLLNEVFIDINRDRSTRTAITGVNIINAESIKTIPTILGERDIIKVATLLPGIKTAGEGAQGFNVRGGKSDENLILLDDGLLYNPFHFFGFFSAVNSYTIHDATIYKGSIPPEYGGRLSSVFDIETKEPDMEKFSGQGGIGPVTSKLTANIPIVEGKASVLVGGRATYSNWILRSLKDQNLKNSEASFYDGLVKYQHNINEKNTLKATLYYSQDKFSITSDSLNTYSNTMGSLKWNHSFSDKHKASLLFTHTRYKFNINFQDDDGLNSFDYGYDINETMGKLKFDYKLSKNHELTYGISSKLYNTSPGYRNPTNPNSLLESKKLDEEKGLESALFLADEFEVSKKLLIKAGLRFSNFSALGKSTQNVYQKGLPKTEATVAETRQYDNNEIIKTYNGLEPRLSARYYLFKDFSVKASYDKNYQYIHLLSTNTTQSPTDTWKLSDFNIKPQTADQYSLGFFKNFTYNKDFFELSVEGYYKKLDNILDYKVGSELTLNRNLETEVLQGEGKAYGVELLVKKTSGRLNGWLGYTYSRTFLKLDGDFQENRINGGDFYPANFDKPHDFSLILNYKFTERYSISANFIYQTGRPITYPIGNYEYNNGEYVLYSDRNKYRIPDYYRMDIGFNIEGNHKKNKLAHSFWNISIYNVLGRNNPYSVYFVTEDGDVKGRKTSIFSIPVPTVTYNFKF